MQKEESMSVVTEDDVIESEYLDREVKLSIYLPSNVLHPESISLLLINDGQNLAEMKFETLLEDLYDSSELSPLLCVGIHCSDDRKNEYGTINVLDFKGRGTKAAAYSKFVFKELLPFIRRKYFIKSFKEKSFCGFSLGGLSALDIVWNNPEEFSKAGVFSGSFWWRTLSQDNILFDENKHRIMHNKIRKGEYYPWLKFFFETGTQDETADRNNNGIIDAIDDTISLIDELILKGYNEKNDIKYLELNDGRHDVSTWAKAFPQFLKWGWGDTNKE